MPTPSPLLPFLLLAAVVAAGVASAQTPADTARADTSGVRLEEVVVRAVRPAATVGGAGAVLLRVDSLPVPPAPRLDEALREAPFVRVRRNARGEAEISVRGSESRQMAVLVDGVPLTLGWDDRADLSVVPMTGAQGITLVRGVPSVLHGPNVLGGVVEVAVARSPLTPPEAASVRGSAGVEHTGARALSAVVVVPFAGGAAETVVKAGAGLRDRRGFALASGVDDPGSEDGLRGNSDAREVDGFLAVRHRTAGGAWLGLSGFGSRSERGVPPELHLRAPRYWRYPDANRAVAAVSAGTGQRRTALGEGDVEATVGVDLGYMEVRSFADRTYRRETGGEEGEHRNLSLRLLGEHTLGSAADLRAAFTLADSRHDETLDPGGTSRYRKRLWSLGGEAERRFALGGASLLTLAAGASADGSETPESGDKEPLDPQRAWGARAGGTLTLGPSATLHAAAGRRVRFPSLREMYSGALGRFLPNPDLGPETLMAMEAGGTVLLGGMQLQAVGFRHRLRDAVVRVSAGGGRFRRENRDEIRSTGVELLADWRRGGSALAGSLTLQRVRILDPSPEGGLRRAEYQPGAAGALDLATPLGLGISAEAGVRFWGRQWCVHPERGTEASIDPSVRADLRAGRSWRLRRAGGLLRTLRAAVALDNVADGAVYDQCGLPQPGRTLRLELRVE
ncbi:MAG TPA: TonB-dependent receptor [Longimicrobiaceae bacterium]|nr:TonB-dependent receptor [Longimicrobiaceae bacterium]